MSKHVGRHRAPGYSPAKELGQIASGATAPAAKVSAIAVLSGGLAAGMAVPAQAAQAPLTGLEGSVVTAPSTPSPDTFGTVGFTTKVVAKAVASKPAAAPKATTAPAPAAAATRQTQQPAASRSSAARAAAPAPAPAASIPNDGSIIGIAASLSGIPYVAGGSSPGTGFDCSGFTSYVYRMAGKSIPRTAAAQQAASTKVSNPQPGDLMFFGIPAYHAAIFAGGGKIYDAQHPGTTTGLHTIWTYSNVTYGRF
ncbi:MAG: C40 family peptidase [Dermatophilaceae bacterium]